MDRMEQVMVREGINKHIKKSIWAYRIQKYINICLLGEFGKNESKYHVIIIFYDLCNLYNLI